MALGDDDKQGLDTTDIGSHGTPHKVHLWFFLCSLKVGVVCIRRPPPPHVEQVSGNNCDCVTLAQCSSLAPAQEHPEWLLTQDHLQFQWKQEGRRKLSLKGIPPSFQGHLPICSRGSLRI